MTTRKYFHMLLPVVFLTTAVVAVIQMEIAIGKNLENTLGQIFFFQQPTQSHSRTAEAWLWIAFACLILGVIFSWRAFRHIKHERHA